jgi:hypothetical protein
MTPEHRLTMSSSHELGTLYQLLHDIGGKVDTLIDNNEKHEETRTLLLNHMSGEDAVIAQFKSAFPAGDPKGHCEWHLAEIERIRSRKEFWQKMTFELAKWGLIGFLGWVVLQLWHGALQGPK